MQYKKYVNELVKMYNFKNVVMGYRELIELYKKDDFVLWRVSVYDNKIQWKKYVTFLPKIKTLWVCSSELKKKYVSLGCDPKKIKIIKKKIKI
jgi:hypothetical protein